MVEGNTYDGSGGTYTSWASTPAATGIEGVQQYGSLARGGTRPMYLAARERWVHKETINFGSITAQSSATQDVTVTGVSKTNSTVLVGVDSAMNGAIITAEVTAADTVTVTAHNPTGSAVNPAEAGFTLVITKEQP